MFQIVFGLHLTLCALLIGLVLLQQGKGADAGALMGGGTDSLLGAGSAGTFVSKLTTSLAVLFMVTSILLVRTYKSVPVSIPTVSSDLEGSLLQDEVIEEPAQELPPAEEAEAAGEESVEDLAATEEAPTEASVVKPEGDVADVAPLDEAATDSGEERSIPAEVGEEAVQ